MTNGFLVTLGMTKSGGADAGWAALEDWLGRGEGTTDAPERIPPGGPWHTGHLATDSSLRSE